MLKLIVLLGFATSLLLVASTSVPPKPDGRLVVAQYNPCPNLKCR